MQKNDIQIDPVIEENEIENWWNIPFIETCGTAYQVRCYDGGAWDRSTNHGVFNTVEDAISKAKKLTLRYNVN